MKTCTFRGSKPRCGTETIFCSMAPEVLYGMKRCTDQICRFCYERLDITHRFEPAMSFLPKQSHCFVNKYRTYLNCDLVRDRIQSIAVKRRPAIQTCSSAHVLYALTCPCHLYDYLGRCKVPLRDRMQGEPRKVNDRMNLEHLLCVCTRRTSERRMPNDALFFPGCQRGRSAPTRSATRTVRQHAF